MDRQIIEIPAFAGAVRPGHQVVVLPVGHESMGWTLDIVSLEGQGFLFTIADPAGTPVWSAAFNFEGAVGGSGFGTMVQQG